MLPREETVVAVPEQTARVAQMAFPKGNVYIWMRGDRFDSPYEPDSRYGKKRSENWRGYKVHISDIKSV